jgi:hypothetical protein
MILEGFGFVAFFVCVKAVSLLTLGISPALSRAVKVLKESLNVSQWYCEANFEHRFLNEIQENTKYR